MLCPYVRHAPSPGTPSVCGSSPPTKSWEGRARRGPTLRTPQSQAARRGLRARKGLGSANRANGRSEARRPDVLDLSLPAYCYGMQGTSRLSVFGTSGDYVQVCIRRYAATRSVGQVPGNAVSSGSLQSIGLDPRNWPSGDVANLNVYLGWRRQYVS